MAPPKEQPTDDFFDAEYVPPAPYRPSERQPLPDPVTGNDDWCRVLPPSVEKKKNDVEASVVNLNKHPSGLIPRVANVVGTFSMGCKINLADISKRARNTEYNAKRFSALVMRIKGPKTTGLLFNSGNAVCTGAINEEECKLGARKFARTVQKCGYDATFQNFKIQNMVAVVNVGFRVQLEMLGYMRWFNSSYEPELFPGMVHRMRNPKLVFLIFVSGNVVMTGAKDRETLTEGFEKLYPILWHFRKEEGNPQHVKDQLMAFIKKFEESAKAKN